MSHTLLHSERTRVLRHTKSRRLWKAPTGPTTRYGAPIWATKTQAHMDRQ